MNLWIRLLWLIICSPFKARLPPPLGVSRLTFRVLPNDLDVNLHMNNGRYLTIMDLGRFDLMLRMGLAGHARRHGWMPVLSAANVLFRREVRLFQKYYLESRIIWWSGTHFLMEHRVLLPREGGASVLAAKAIMHGGLYERANRRFVPVSELMTVMGVDEPAPAVTPEIEAALAAIQASKASKGMQAQDL